MQIKTPSILPPFHLHLLSSCCLSYQLISVSPTFPTGFVTLNNLIHQKNLHYSSLYRPSQVFQQNGMFIQVVEVIISYYCTIKHCLCDSRALPPLDTINTANISDNVVSRSTYLTPRSTLIHADYSYDQLHRETVGRNIDGSGRPTIWLFVL